MRLKALEIQGFKSFPDRVKIEFDAGITAIVGPNGSGKSNIVDAVRWVLGEQNSRTLRGAKMEDVIFMGAESRKAVGFAEVSLIIDNGGHMLVGDFDEVTVTRRLYRSGESEYYINKTPSRLRDIHELFMNTGLGRDGYSLIGQGKISEIITAKSADRRQIFEEAAGISKYRYRKQDTERKLEATEDNLVRIRDILGELEARLGPLKTNSEKAKRFLDLAAEKKKLDIAVWLDGIDKSKDQIEKAERDFWDAKAALDSTTAAIEELERAGERASSEMAEMSFEISRIQEETGKIREVIEERTREIAVLKNDMVHAEEAVLTIGESARESSARIAEIDARISEREAEKAEKEKERVKTSLEIEGILVESEERTGRISGLEGEIEALRHEILINGERASSLSGELASVGEAETARALRLTALSSEREAAGIRLRECEVAVNGCRGRISGLEEKIAAGENVITGYRTLRESRGKRTEEAESAVSSLTVEHAKTGDRLRMLEDMESQLEGFAGSVRRVIREGERGRLTGIHGPVSGIIEVEREHVVAIETALGGALQNIVVGTEEDAKAAMTLLKRENAGRATFLPISSVRPYSMNEKGLEDEDGFVGYANRLVRHSEQYAPVMANLLARTAVVEDIDRAVLIARKYSYRFRIVTLDGQVINSGGSMTGGSSSRSGGVLSRRGEIAELSEKLSHQSLALAVAKEELLAAREELQAASAAYDGAVAEQNTRRDELVASSGDLAEKSASLESAKSAAESLEREFRELVAQSARDEARRADIAHQSDLYAARIAELEAGLSELVKGRDEAKTESEAIISSVSERRMRALSLAKEIEGIDAAVAQYRSQRTLYEGESEGSESRMAAARAEILEKTSLVEAAEAEILKLEGDLTAAKDRIAKITSARTDVELSLTRGRQEIRELTTRKETEITAHTRLEGRRASTLAEYDLLIAKLWDEYELTYSAADEIREPVGSMTAARSRISAIRSEIKSLGNVNVDAIEEYKEVSERCEFLTGQVADLERSGVELLGIIEELTAQMRVIFKEQFDIINVRFGEIFVELFGGGKAELELSDPGDVLESGIEIKVQPPGKIIKSLQVLSGGEQAFAAIALYFALMSVRPTLFCLLDEIEAALDEENVSRFSGYLRRMSASSQFIVITHRRALMEEADMIYGVTMQEKGVSKLLSLKLGEVEKKLGIKG